MRKLNTLSNFNTLIIGIVVGTYSSIYVASAALLALGVSKFDLLQVEKEGAGATAEAWMDSALPPGNWTV